MVTIVVEYSDSVVGGFGKPKLDVKCIVVQR